MARDVYLLEIGGFVAGQYVENVLAYLNTVTNSTQPEIDAIGLVSGWYAEVRNEWLACLPSDYQLSGLRARRVNNGGGPSGWMEGIAENGTLGVASVTSGGGPVVTASYYNSGGSPARWRTTRLFMPGVPDGQIIGNEIQPDLSAALADLITQLNDGLAVGTETFLYCAWSRSQKVSYSLSNFNVSQLIGTQRKRLRPAL